MNDFEKEVHMMSTNDLMLIVQDQADLYTEEEFKILKRELDMRRENPAEAEERLALEAKRSEEERIRKQRLENERLAQITRDEHARRQKKILKEKGYEGYYEYKTLTLTDNNGGGISVDQITKLLNYNALEGWRLVSAYTNELGHNSMNGGYAPGTNATIDQHILILERFVRL